ncbi:hypothetical protein [Paenibacillus sp. Z6-24]
MSIFSGYLSKWSEQLQNDPSVLGVLLGGTEIYSNTGASAGMEAMIIITDEEFEQRLQRGSLHYRGMGSTGAVGQMVTGRYISPGYMDKVARFGSEPARFAFMGVVIVFSRLADLRNRINDITEYPLQQKQDNINRFYAQFEAWYQECRKALITDEPYLLRQSVMNMVLFGGRLILAHNEMLYPGHKWLIHTLEHARKKPERLLKTIRELMTEPSESTLELLYRQVLEYHDWVGEDLNWTDYVILDNELQWMSRNVSVGEI